MVVGLGGVSGHHTSFSAVFFQQVGVWGWGCFLNRGNV